MRTAAPRHLSDSAAAARLRRAAVLLATDEQPLRRTARRFSACAEDAEDAFQRAAEILIRKGPELERPRLLAWMQVVTRNEALAVRRERRRLRPYARVPSEASAEVEEVPAPGPDPAAAVEARERVALAASELGGLKPQERRALALQAAGCSYAEIQAITGWTYTKVNRCLAEGRAALRSLPSFAA